jgi:hypothetical protein
MALPTSHSNGIVRVTPVVDVVMRKTRPEDAQPTDWASSMCARVPVTVTVPSEAAAVT